MQQRVCCFCSSAQHILPLSLFLICGGCNKSLAQRCREERGRDRQPAADGIGAVRSKGLASSAHTETRLPSLCLQNTRRPPLSRSPSSFTPSQLELTRAGAERAPVSPTGARFRASLSPSGLSARPPFRAGARGYCLRITLSTAAPTLGARAREEREEARPRSCASRRRRARATPPLPLSPRPPHEQSRDAVRPGRPDRLLPLRVHLPRAVPLHARAQARARRARARRARGEGHVVGPYKEG
jgi:hypothetical protein